MTQVSEVTAAEEVWQGKCMRPAAPGGARPISGGELQDCSVAGCTQTGLLWDCRPGSNIKFKAPTWARHQADIRLQPHLPDSWRRCLAQTPDHDTLSTADLLHWISECDFLWIYAPTAAKLSYDRDQTNPGFSLLWIAVPQSDLSLCTNKD